MRLWRVTKNVLALILVLYGLTLAYPRRGDYSATLVGSCQLRDGKSALLFLGNGGALTRFSYSVIVRRRPWEEWHVFYSYSSPAVSSISCDDDQISIHSPSGTSWRINASDVIEGRSGRFRYSFGTGGEFEPEIRNGLASLSFLDKVRIGCGLLFVLVGTLAIVVPQLRRPKRVG